MSLFVFTVPKGVCVYDMTEFKVSTVQTSDINTSVKVQQRGGSTTDRQKADQAA